LSRQPSVMSKQNPKLRNIRPHIPGSIIWNISLSQKCSPFITNFQSEFSLFNARNDPMSSKRSSVKRGWLNSDHKVKKIIDTHIRARSTVVFIREGMKTVKITEDSTRANSQGKRSFSSSFWSASDSRSDGHECPECSTTLNHRLPDVWHQFSTPHSISNCSKSPKYEPGRHPDAKSKSKARLRPVPARGTLLTVGLRGKRHCLC